MNDTTRRAVIGVAAFIGLGLIVAAAINAATSTGADETTGYGEPTIAGEMLAPFEAAGNDPAVGESAPEVTSVDIDGETPRTVGASENAKILIFLAHWCPHCQAEVRRISEWAKTNDLPEGVEIYGILTYTDRLRPNWPPADWLKAEGWPYPNLLDDKISSVAAHFGMSGTPFWVVLRPDNTVAARLSGELPVEAFEQLLDFAAGLVAN